VKGKDRRLKGMYGRRHRGSTMTAAGFGGCLRTKAG